MFEKSYEIFSKENNVDEENTEVIFEITLSNLRVSGEIDEKDFMDRAKLLCSLGHTVMISDFKEYYRLIDYFSNYTKKQVGLSMGVNNFVEIFNEQYYKDLSGKENIIFIIVDDLRDLVMADNQLEIITPNIDKLKKRGVNFKNSFTNNPVCGASRASILTGLRPTKSRFRNYDTKINKDAPNSLTIASYLRNNGYKTISNGKIFFIKPTSI